MATIRQAATEEDLLRTPRDGQKYELVDGQIRGGPGGYLHGLVSMRLATRLGMFVEDRKLGDAFGPRTGFRLPGGNVRVPDLTFVALGRFPDAELPEGFANLAPGPEDLLDGEDVVPGFRCRLADVVRRI